MDKDKGAKTKGLGPHPLAAPPRAPQPEEPASPENDASLQVFLSGCASIT